MKTLWKIIISHIQYRKQILQLAKTDLIKTYRGALLSWGWAILKPAITIAVYYFAFTVGLRTGKAVKGYPYFLWLISGFIPWFYISAIYTGGAYSLHKYAFLVKKIKFPVCCVPMIVGLSNMIVHLALTLLMIIIFIAMGAPVTIYLAQLLYLLARRRQRTRKQSPRARAEQEQAALVESVRLYFAQNIEKPLALDQVCDANGCSRVALQQAFRTRTRMGPMEYFSCMKAEQAALLLTQGYGPGETARMLGYGSLAWFSRRFHALTGQTPGAYRRAPHPLHLCER